MYALSDHLQWWIKINVNIETILKIINFQGFCWCGNLTAHQLLSWKVEKSWLFVTTYSISDRGICVPFLSHLKIFHSSIHSQMFFSDHHIFNLAKYYSSFKDRKTEIQQNQRGCPLSDSKQRNSRDEIRREIQKWLNP